MQSRQLQMQKRVRSLIDHHSERLHVLETQAAREGIYVRPHVEIEIKRINQMIAELDEKLQKLSEQPIDEAELDVLSDGLSGPAPERTQISLDSQNQMGSITIGDVAGHDIIKSTVAPQDAPSYGWIVPVLLLVLVLLLIGIGLVVLRVLSA